MSMSKKKIEALAAEVKQLRKSKGNLICADCPMRNTTYVNTSHNTFVCTDCSGILRKYAFRVKSIHAASFRQNEVDALREGGNKVVNAQYMAKFKKGKGYELPQLGDSRKIDEFIQAKYVQKRWFGDSPGKKSKKKKQKKKVETPPDSSSDDDSSSDSDSSSDEPVVVQKKSKKKKGKKQIEKKKKSKKGKKAAVAEEPVDLFQPVPAPVPQQQASNDDWASFDDNSWDAFGTSSAPAAAPVPQAPAPNQAANSFFNTPAPAANTQQTNWQQPMQQPVPQQQSKANSGISPNDPFFAAFQKPKPQAPTQAAAAPKNNDPFAELMAASSTQSTNSTPDKTMVNNGPSNPFGGTGTQNNQNPFGGTQPQQTGGWGAAPQTGAPQQAYGMQQQQYGYPPQTQQQYGYPPQTQQQYGYPPQTQQQQYGYAPQQQYMQQNMQQNFANMNMQSGGTQPGANANPWA